jgi:hypothetical protein
METGVWRGGACIFVAALLRALDDTERRVWLADTFTHMPLTDGRYRDVEGRFKETLPKLAAKQWGCSG